MKKITLIVLLLFGFLANAQLIEEHLYEEGVVTRVNFPGIGEKYYLIDSNNGRVKFFNADHSDWMTIELNLAPGFQYLQIGNVSSDVFNSDSQIEITVEYLTADFTYVSQVLAADGTVLYSGNFTINVDQTDGLAPKMFMPYGDSEQVYSLPGFNLEHTYPSKQLHRINLENSGEKYVYFDNNTSTANLFNADHTPWKTINCPKPDNFEYGTYYLVSETKFNADPQLEIAYSYLLYEAPVVVEQNSRVVNESSTLITIPNSGSFWFSMLQGYETKFEVLNNFTSSTYSTTIYSLPDLTPEITFTPGIQRVALALSGEKYFRMNGNFLTIYNSDYSFWKDIALPITEGFSPTGITFISETTFNNSPQVDFIFGSKKFIDNGAVIAYESKLVTEGGTVLQTFPDLYYLKFSHIEGLEDKFIGEISESGIFPISRSSVYSIQSQLATDFINADECSVYPNPASSFVNLEIKGNAITDASIFDLSGKSIGGVKAANIKGVDVSAYLSGVYFIHLTDADGNKSVKKLIISH
ncbi:MAG: hypothetical protein CFE23_05070 [Flavobacterium sp. BFFFF1]|uniref:T9SS type A sorting domain-containing protein n=1 Tax=Flavobacterium sp. BFFFF1 TaxID=2015557 RepID=UPI000BC803C5|nr:T9SS type A sorting domain-containing protein [Flavobacterium sp. BFFFF1]OYU81457.1 MAG: hypothetical protein CFE23_05070 [Flavobacterium sp. BFFFF1]